MGVHLCTGPIWQRGVADCNAGWGLVTCGEPQAPVPSQLRKSGVSAVTPTLGKRQTLSFSTVFIDYSETS